MDTIFTLGDEIDDNIKINLDDLYERKKQHDLHTLTIYNKILGRIHNKIKLTSRQHLNNEFCWYVVPEMILGVPKYDNGACIAYLIDKLQDNGFIVRYTHPNLLLISWKHHVAKYVRDEIKKKTGIIVDSKGNPIDKDGNNNNNNEPKDPDEMMLMRNNKGSLNINGKNNGKEKDYKPINSYKPTGNLIYNDNLFRKIEEKTSDNRFY
jgi:hypothetical protein